MRDTMIEEASAFRESFMSVVIYDLYTQYYYEQTHQWSTGFSSSVFVAPSLCLLYTYSHVV